MRGQKEAQGTRNLRIIIFERLYLLKVLYSSDHKKTQTVESGNRIGKMLGKMSKRGDALEFTATPFDH